MMNNIYISNDCLPYWIYTELFNTYIKFPLSAGVFRVKEYIKLIKNIDNIDFNITDFYITDDNTLWCHDEFKDNSMTVLIDNKVEYLLIHDLQEGYDIEKSKDAYYRRLKRWDGNKDNIVFNIIVPNRPLDKTATPEEYYELINYPCKQRKNIIIFNEDKKEKYSLQGFDESKIIKSNNVKIYHVNNIFPQDYIKEITNTDYFK